INGNFSETAGLSTPYIIYDPQPQVAGWESLVPAAQCPVVTTGFGGLGPDDRTHKVARYLKPDCRTNFTSEYGETASNINTIPASRQMSPQATTMTALLAPI